MKSLNIKVSIKLSTIIMLCLFVVACGGPVAYTNTSNAAIATQITGTLSAVSTSIPYNSSTTITWSSVNTTPCTFSGDSSTGVSGSFVTPRLTTTTIYTLTCGSTNQSITINVSSAAVASAITHFAAGTGNVMVSSLNALTNGTLITISGTTNYNGSYTVSNVTPTSFTITATFNGDDATGVWQLAGGMINGCSTQGAGLGAINMAAYNVSRFTGVAPLSVFFDASGTTATTTTHPFHDIEYQWGFGDIDPISKALNLSPPSPLIGGTSTWNTGSKPGVNSRNAATGPVAAHVYETPGVYTVALTATDGTNTVKNSCAQIVVQNPDTVFAGTNTICVSATSLPVAGSGGCPPGASTAQQPSFPAAISSYAKTGKRVLFKRGDTFTGATAATVSVTGPGTIGAFGDPNNNKPVIQGTGNTNILVLSTGNPYVSDWRVMDLTIDGLSGTNTTGVSGGGTAYQETLLRLDIRNVAYGITFDTSGLRWTNTNGGPTQTIWDQITIADSTIAHIINAGYGMFFSSSRLALLGNSITDVFNGQAVVRFPQLVRSIVNNNTLSDPGSTKEVIKLHAPTWCTTLQTTCNWTTDTEPADPVGNNGVTSFGYSEKILISDNKLTGVSNSAWMVTSGPQNNTNDERVRDVIFERNWLVAGSGTVKGLVIFSRDTTLRNNICDFSLASNASCFNPRLWGTEPPADNVKIYNNTGYTSAAGSTFSVVHIENNVTNIELKNNLGYAPSSSSPHLVDGTSAAVSTNNTSDAQMKTYPSFVAPLPTVPAPTDFKIVTGSYAIGTGAAVPVWSDFFSVPQMSTRDLGAALP